MPSKGWVVGLDRDTCIDILMPKILQFLPEDIVAKVTYGDVPEIRMKDGSYARFKTAAAGRRKFQSAALDWVWIDEEIEEPVVEEIRARLIDRKGALWMTMTPLMGKTWLYYKVLEPWQEGKIRRVDVFRWSMKDNTTLDPQVVEDFLSKVPKHLRPARELGEFVDLEGLIWPQFDEKVHVVDAFPIPTHWPVILAMDPGYRHPFSAGFQAVNERGDRFLFAEWHRPKMLASQHAKGMIDVLREHCPHLVNERAVDAAFRSHAAGVARAVEKTMNVISVIDPSAAQVKQELRPFGVFPQDANRDMDSGINRVGEMLHLAANDMAGGLYFMRGRVPVHITQMRSYAWKYDEERKRQVPQDIHDDAMDDTRYGCQVPTPAITDVSRPPKRGTADWYDRLDQNVVQMRSFRANRRVSEAQLHIAAEMQMRRWR